MKCLTIKKPRFIGVYAGMLEAAFDTSRLDLTYAERKTAGRKAVAKAYLDKEVTLLSIIGERYILVDALPDVIPASTTVEGTGTLHWVGEDGSIVIAITKVGA